MNTLSAMLFLLCSFLEPWQPKLLASITPTDPLQQVWVVRTETYKDYSSPIRFGLLCSGDPDCDVPTATRYVVLAFSTMPDALSFLMEHNVRCDEVLALFNRGKLAKKDCIDRSRIDQVYREELHEWSEWR